MNSKLLNNTKKDLKIKMSEILQKSSDCVWNNQKEKPKWRFNII